MAGIPLFGTSSPDADPPPLLSGRQYMRGPGVDSSGAAIQLPATAPIGPTAAVTAIGNAMARPGGIPQSLVAGGGTNGPTMTPQELVAAKAASTPALGRMLFGDGAIDAAQQANASPSTAGALGAGLRSAGLAAVHPYQVAGSVLGSIGHAAAGAVNDFAHGLMGGTAAAAPVPVAAPAPAPAAAPARPALSIEPGPRPGVGIIRSGNHVDYVSTEGTSAAPAAEPQFIPRTVPDNAAPGTVTDLSGGLMRNPAYRAPAAAAGGAAQPSDLERQLGLEAGYVAKTLHDAPAAKRPELIQLYSGLRGAAQTNAVRGQYISMANDRYHGQLNAAGDDATKQFAARQELMERMLSIISPSAISAGYLPGSLQQQ